MDSPYQRFRPLAARLAVHFASADGRVILSQLAALSGLRSDKKRRPPRERFWLKLGRFLRWRTPDQFPRVAIWRGRRGASGLEFERDRAQFPLWRAFAPVDRIPAKSTRKRIVLIGDSVVRGAFYDPAYTPAMVMQDGLDRMEMAAEVIDLGRTAAQPSQILALIRQLPALQPDVVILAGANNLNCDFHKEGYPEAERGALAAALQAGLVVFRDRVRARCVDATAKAIVDALAQTTRKLGIPAIVVVGESNLADWQDEVPLPWLPLAVRTEWHQAKDGAEAACAEGNWTEAKVLALRMRNLDSGLVPDAERLLGRIALATGEMESARSHFAAARDAAGGLPYWVAPRCLSSTQATLREQARRHGFHVVDLPELFAREGKIAGREFFMDYCHLSARGMAVMTTALVEALAEAMNFRRKAESGRLEPLRADSAVAAMAHLLAATHHVVLSQPADLAGYHCHEALRLDAKVSPWLPAYLRARASTCPDWLDGELVAQCSLPNATRYLNRIIHAAEGRYATTELRTVLASFSQMDDVGAVHGDGWHSPLEESGRLDLLDGRFRPKRMPFQKSTHLVEKKPRTDIVFFRPPTGAKLSLCYRTPHAGLGTATWSLRLDGKEVRLCPSSREWLFISLALPGGTETRATLSFVWPEVMDLTDEIWRSMIAAVDRGEVPDIYPSFGEIQTCRLDW